MFYIEKRKTKLTRRLVFSYGAVVVIGVAFLAGWYVGREEGSRSGLSRGQRDAVGTVEHADAPPSYLLENVNFELFWEVWNLAKEKYLDQPVLDSQLFYGALGGIVASLGDPYSVFLNPETTQKFTEELAGTFEGIGAEIGIKKEQLVVVAPLPETPADAAGLLPGDKILKIDDKDTTGMPIDVAVSHIRGPHGTTVTLKILRNGWKEPRDFPIIRETINVKSVTVKELAGNLVAIKIIYFNETTPELFEAAVQTVLAKNPKGLILDLRNNPGGFLEVGVRVASQWLEAGQVVVVQEFKGNKQEEFKAQVQGRLRGIPTVVLVNQGSASAAEIVAGALRDHQAATLVGEKTFGKGSVQTLEQLRGGASVKLTIAHWVTPNGSKINGEGIAPEVEVKMVKEDYENDRDPQFKKAVELLSK